MAQGEVGRLVEFPLTRALFHRHTKYVAEGCTGQTVNQFFAGMCLFAPFLRVAFAVGCAFAYDAFVENTVLDFQEETADTAFPI